MSDRKAELERKRKRLEEIKKAREEKKKVIVNWFRDQFSAEYGSSAYM